MKIKTPIFATLAVAGLALLAVIGCTPTMNFYSNGYPLAREVNFASSVDGKLYAKWVLVRWPLENPSSMAPAVIRTPSLTTVVPPPVIKTQRSALTIREIVTNTSNIEIRANQAINSYKTMELTSPDRLVIDFPSDSVNQEAASVAINKFGISKLRIGVSPQNIRMVLDSKESGLPAYKLEMAAEGLKIVFEDELQMISYKRENH